MMTAMTATDLRHRHLVCLLDESRHLMCVDLDLLRSPSATGNQRWWAALDRTGPIDVSPQGIMMSKAHCGVFLRFECNICCRSWVLLAYHPSRGRIYG